MNSPHNFRDPNTGETFHIPTYRTIISSEGRVHKDKYGKVLVNPTTGTVLEEIPRDPNEPFTVPFFAKSNNKEELSKMLSARSKEHYKKEIADVRYQKNKDLVDKFNDK